MDPSESDRCEEEHCRPRSGMHVREKEKKLGGKCKWARWREVQAAGKRREEPERREEV